MSVGTIVRTADDAGESSFTDTVGGFRLERVVGTVTDVGMGTYAFCLHFPGDDINNSSHRI